MKLKKELGFLDVFSIASGAMVSSGIFILPSLAFTKVGPGMVVSYFIGGLIAILGVLSVVELTTAMPKAGGSYFFIKRAMGPLAGTITGILSWFALSLKTAFAIFGIAGVVGGAIFGPDLNYFTLVVLSFIITAFFVFLNIVGVDLASKFEIVLVVGLLIIMTGFVIFGIGKVSSGNFDPFIKIYELVEGKFVEDKVIETFSLGAVSKVLATTAFVFVSFGGLLQASSIAEEVKNPEKNMVWGLISSVVVITIFYTLMLIVAIGQLDGDSLANSITPMADAGKKFLGPIGYYGIITASMLAFISTANAGIMAASRFPLAMARDDLISDRFGEVNQKTKTPILAIIATGIFISLSLLLPIEYLAKTASAVILISYILTNVCLIILRESNIKNYRPTFRVPLYPFIPIISIFIFWDFLLSLGFMPLFLCSLLGAGSFLVYFYYGRKNQDGEHALMHLLVRMTKNINIDEHHLESELRGIIHERDEVELDYFDKLIEESKFIDLEEELELEELFKIEARNFTEELHMSEKELINLLRKREEEVCTAINDFTAIPHITIDQDVFKMAVFRCREGVYFCNSSKKVKAIFLFISGESLAKEHLQTIASIVSIVREEEFEEKWLEAKNENYMKDLILLSERKRFKK